jgi:hypothetical protein
MLPKDLEDAIAQAKVAVQAALAAGQRRIQVELVIPELKMMPIAAQFLTEFEAMESALRVYFPDAGSAALARRDWGEKAYPIRGIGDVKADIQEHEQLFIFVEPASVEVLEVEKLCEVAGDRPVILLNPRMEDIATIGIGYAGRQLRERFLNQFVSCYYLRPMETATVFRAFPGTWEVWINKNGEDEKVAEVEQRPAGEALEQILVQAYEGDADTPDAIKQAVKPGLMSSLQGFLRALSR